jgi:hypothetical protein
VAAGDLVNTRDVIIVKSRPFLEPGEVVAHVVRALEGPPRWLAMILALVIGLGVGALIRVPFLGFPIVFLVYTGSYQRRIVLATDRAVLLIAGGRFRFAPRKLLARLDVETRIGPVRGLFLRIEVAGRRLYAVPRSAAEVAAADADLEES